MKITVQACALVGVLVLLQAPGAVAPVHAGPAAAPVATSAMDATDTSLVAQALGPAAVDPTSTVQPASQSTAQPAESAAAGPAADPAPPGADNVDSFESEIAAELDQEFAAEEREEVLDPLSGYNRFMTGFNDALYVWALSPAAKGYRFVVPEFARRGIANLFDNLLFPVRFVNNLMQLKVAATGTETLRFVSNSTLGVAGLWDPAKVWFGLERRQEDFGQTLGYYGVGPGFHIVLPVLGPSNVRDAFAVFPDYYLEPVSYVDPWEPEYLIRAYDRVNYTSLHLGEYEDLKKDAIDLYPFLRDLYEQNRIGKIKE